MAKIVLNEIQLIKLLRDHYPDSSHIEFKRASLSGRNADEVAVSVEISLPSDKHEENLVEYYKNVKEYEGFMSLPRAPKTK